MDDLISRKSLIKSLNKFAPEHYTSLIDTLIKKEPRVDTILKGVYNQVAWERDLAMMQLEEHGIPFGCKADVQTVRHGKWKFHKDGSGTCNRCNFTSKNVWDFDSWQNYCGHCGAKMDGECEQVMNKNIKAIIGFIIFVVGIIAAICCVITSVVLSIQNPDMTDMRFMIEYPKLTMMSFVSVIITYIGAKIINQIGVI